MSGRKQHYIPQMLLKGFGVPKNKKVYVTVYHFERDVFTVPTDGIAAERDFYSGVDNEESIVTLDDKITSYENFISAALAKVRSVELGTEVDRLLVSELITHLIVRNNFIRVNSASMVGEFFNELGGVFANKEATRIFLGLGGKEPSTKLAASIAEVLAEKQREIEAIGLSNSQARDLAFDLLRSSFDDLHQVIQPLANALLSTGDQAAEISARSQKRGMEKELSPPQRVERMMEFEWRVVEAKHSLLLPDCVAVSLMKDGSVSPLILSGFDDVDRIFMPVSSNRVLVGARFCDFELPKDFNQMASRCAWDFFVNECKCDEMLELRSNIRIYMQGFSKNLVKEAIASAMEED